MELTLRPFPITYITRLAQHTNSGLNIGLMSATALNLLREHRGVDAFGKLHELSATNFNPAFEFLKLLSMPLLMSERIPRTYWEATTIVIE
jgi:hypothetical protein